MSPLDWDFSDIKPVKKKDKEERIPLNNCPITFMGCKAKIYSSILNVRLQKHLNHYGLLDDEQMA